MRTLMSTQGDTLMSSRSPYRATRWAVHAMLAVSALLFAAPAAAAQILANADAFQTLPGAASITLPSALGGAVVPMEGAEFSTPAPGTPFYPLTTADATRLNNLAPNLGLVQLAAPVGGWAHGTPVGPTSIHKVGQVLVPVVNTTPNFDTVVQRLTTLNFTSAGRVQESQIRVLMLDLQSVAPVVIGGFHYEVFAVFANGSPVYDPAVTSAPQYLGNMKFDVDLSHFIGGLGHPGPGRDGADPNDGKPRAQDLPSGMEAPPLNFQLQFMALDGGPALPNVTDELIFQNTGLSSFNTVPEPSSFAILLTASLMMAGGAALRRTRAA